MNWSDASAGPDGGLLVVLAGPTAVGKSDVALAVALRVGGEIVAADSMTVYRGLDRGTAKPSAEDRRLVPHHLIDVVGAGEPFSVARYQTLARAAVAGVHRRGRVPLLVGGTGLYVSAVIDYPDFPPAPPSPALRALLAGEEPASLHRRLHSLAPEAAARIHPADRRRLIRALEVLSHGPSPAGAPPRHDLLMFGLRRERHELYRRIEARVDLMFRRGLVEEVATLRAAGLTLDAQSMQALGYKQVFAHLEGECSLEHAISLVKRDTRRYAKRQLTWFRRDRRIAWITLGEDRGTGAAAADIAGQVAARWGRIVE